jgi:hypothetical protein
LNKVYEVIHRGIQITSAHIAAQDLALLYIVLAKGAYYNLELPADDSSVEDYLSLAKCCLSKGDFLANNTITGLQALVITVAMVVVC